MKNNSKCPICGSDQTQLFLKRSGVPVHQNILMQHKDDARNITCGELNLFFCSECGFVYNQKFEPAILMYGENYDNTQTHSAFFRKYIDQLVNYLLNEKGVRNSRIVEVGCGKGTFLKQLVGNKETGNTGVGFDPSYVGTKEDKEGRVRFEKRYYGPDCADVSADVVVSRHVIEHVLNPLDLLISIREALINSPTARVFIETPCVEWILKNKVVWDFFYEHCSYFNKNSLTTALQIAGFNVIKIEHVFGNQYLWAEAIVSSYKTGVYKQPDNIHELAHQYKVVDAKIANWKKLLAKQVHRGKTAVWGAGAKGVTFVNLVDPNCENVDCVVDLNPEKQGRYVPGTGHLIIDFFDLKNRGVTDVVLMNPNYLDEIQQMLNQNELNINLIEVRM